MALVTWKVTIVDFLFNLYLLSNLIPKYSIYDGPDALIANKFSELGEFKIQIKITEIGMLSDRCSCAEANIFVLNLTKLEL